MKKICFKRLMSLVLCIITVLGSFPLSASAQTTDENGAVVYEIGDRVWMRGEEAEPAAESAPQGTFWIPEYDDNDQPVTRQGLCTKQEHSHVYACAPDCALAHTHSETCYTLVYPNCIEHSHDENCAVTVYDCGKAEHDHEALDCTAVESCTEHNHADCNMIKAYTCGMEAHAHDESCNPTPTYPECADHTEHTEACHVVNEYSCGKEVHDHEAYGCPAEEVCTVHDHSQCNMIKAYTCGIEAHVHDESCNPTRAYPNCTEHSHDENCISENRLSCGKEEHICISEGCAPDCAIEEHSHTAECDMDALYYSWELVEDTSAALAASDKGLPVHFFIALPGQAANPNGTYENFGENYWGRQDKSGDNLAYALPSATDDSIIYSENGIRNVSDESLITAHVDATTKAIMDLLKNVDTPVVDGVSYPGYKIKWVTICQRNPDEASDWWDWRMCYCGARYDHIHIDAVLTKEVAPADMKLTKTIPAAENYPQNFTFNLQRLMQDESYNPINQFDEVFGTKTLSATIPAGQTSASIVSTDGTKVGFGYYKLTENASTGWDIENITIVTSSGQNRVINGGDLFIQIARDGTMKFSQSYNGQWYAADEIIINNKRSPLTVSYEWVGIPEGLTSLPTAAQGIPYNSVHSINTSYYPGVRVPGTGDTAAYYYEFQGWQHIDPAVGERTIIQYGENDAMTPSSFNVTSDTVIHGVWTQHELSKADGYITIQKTFIDRPEEAKEENFYFRVRLNDGAPTDITPISMGKWNGDNTVWTYDFPVSENGTYTVAEGKYNVKGYTATTESKVVPVENVSSDGGEYIGPEIITEGHKYNEVGRKVTITLPYDTAAVYGTAALNGDKGIHTATVEFKNSYEKKIGEAVNEYPSLIVRKTNSRLDTPLAGAEFQLMKGGESVQGTADALAVRYDLQEGEYTLTETKAPDGYKKLDTVYTVSVTKDGDAVSQLQMACDSEDHVHTPDCYEFVSTQRYKTAISVNGVDVNTEEVPGKYEITDLNNAWLSVPNEQITADLTIEKTFSDITDESSPKAFTPDSGSIIVDIYGPVQRDDAGNITSIGSLWKNDLIISADSVDADGKPAPWQTTVRQLPYGEYFVEEVMASIHGYKWVDSQYNNTKPITVDGRSGIIVEVDGNSDALSLHIENRYTPWDAADFYVVKTDGTQKRLPGAEFRLYDSNNDDVTASYAQPDTGITNADGYIHFDGFSLKENETSKTFTLKELKAPNGYYLSAAEYTVTVTRDAVNAQYDITVSTNGTSATYDHDIDVLTVPNSPMLGEITVKKSFAGDEIPKDSHITVHLANASGNITKTANLTDGEEWQYTFRDLPLDTYTLTETYSSALGYSYTTQYKVNNADTATDGNAATLTLSDTSDGTLASLPDSAKGSVEFINTYKRVEKLTVNAGSFIVFKRNEAGEALPGAEFTLYSDEGCTQELSNVPEGFIVKATSGGIDGAANFTGLKLADHAYKDYKTAPEHNATYYLKESEAPDGYQLSDTVWKIRLEEDHVQIDKLTNNSFFETIVNWIAGKGSETSSASGYEWITDHALSVVNYPIKGSVNVSKSFVDANGTALDPSKYQNARIELHVHGPITRDTDGSIKDIGPLVEKIELRKEENSSFPTETVENLATGEYVIRETFASIHGYTWNSATYKVNGEATETQSINGTEGFALFEVESATPINISVTNSYTEWKKADFYIRKLKTGTETGLAGAEFVLYSDEACENEVMEATTDISGYAHFDGLEVEQGQPKKLFLKEVTAPTNYYLSDAVYTVKVTHDNTAYDIDITVPTGGSAEWKSNTDTLWVYNEEIRGSITVSKEFDEGIDEEDKPEQIRLSLKGHDQDQEIVLPDNGEWKKTIQNLPMGNYIVYEQAANVDGYTLKTNYVVTAADASVSGQESSPTSSNEYAQIHLTPDNTQLSVEVTNTYKKKTLAVTPADFTVKKLESGSNKPLKDAVFILRDVDGAEIARATTGENGLALFNDLKMPDKDYEDYKAPNRSVTYYLSEIVAPEGYVRDETVWKVQLSENVTLFDREENGKFGIVDWIAGIFQTGSDTAIEGDVLTVYNLRKSYPVSVKKTVTYQGLADPANDYMVKHSLSKAEYEFALYIDGEPVEKMKLKAGEEKSFTKTVPYGSSYEVKEFTAEKPIFSSVLSANAKGSIDSDLGNAIAVTAENTYRFTDGGRPIVLEMLKVSGDIYRKPLAGARFSLRDSGNELLGAYESDQNGRFYISGVFNAPDTYWLIENRAPAGYRAGGPIAIDVKYDISVIYNADNQPVIVRTPVATVTGSHVFHIANNAYGVKNDVIFTPKTGDDNDLMLWSILSLFGLLGTGSAFTLSRRKRYRSRH